MADMRKPLILTMEAPGPGEAVPEQAPAPAAVPPQAGPTATPAKPSAPAPAAYVKPPPLPRPQLRVAPQGPFARAAQSPKSQARAGDKAASTREVGPGLARWAYPAAAAGAVLWAGCLVTFTAGYERGAFAFDYAPFRYALTAGLALLPAALMLVFAYMVRQGARLAEAARRAQAMAEEIALPAALAGARAGAAAAAVREEVARAQAAADEAARRMTALNAALAEEAQRVAEAAVQAERAASRLGGRLASERAELQGLSGALDAQLASAAEGAALHARLAAEASDLASANLAEAQAALAAQTAGLVEAAGEAGRAAATAGGDLAREAERLTQLKGDLAREQAAWNEAAQALLADEDELSVRLETGRARLAEVTAEARAGVETLGATARAGGEALAALIADAVRHAETLAAAARAHADEGPARTEAARAALERDTAAALERLAAAAEAAQATAARSAAALAAEAEAAGEAARLRIEGVAEAAFAAGQRADQAFDTRLTAARRAIEAQANLVEEAGERSAARIESGVEKVRAALAQASALADEVDRRLTRTPPTAPRPAAAPPAGVEPSARRPATGLAPADRVELARPGARPPVESAPTPPVAPALRPRLRLAAVDEDSALFADGPAPAPPPADAAPAPPTADPAPSAAAAPRLDGDAWSWKDLLTSMDDGPPLDDDALAQRMIGEIEAMGVDPGALLPRARIDEIARAVDAGDGARAREAVRRLAPAAVRRLSRRVLTDKVLRSQAETYRRRYGELVADQARRWPDAGGASMLLGCDPGRAFLLLDAAIGDLH